MVLALNLLSAIGTDGSIGRTDSDHSVLSAASRAATPLFAPMGISEHNWPAVLGIFSGVLAKEVIVGTLDTVYGRLAKEADETDEERPFAILDALAAAAATVPANLASIGESLTDPLGLGVGVLSDRGMAAEEQGVTTGTFGAMEARFDGRAGAFAYLLFVLLYFPCVATIGAIVRETSRAWAAFVAAWSTGIAFVSATIFYQAATFETHPASSTAWIVGLSIALIGVLLGLRAWSQNGHRVQPQEIDA
jgi:ferrous iron transport protein B